MEHPAALFSGGAGGGGYGFADAFAHTGKSGKKRSKRELTNPEKSGIIINTSARAYFLRRFVESIDLLTDEREPEA